MGIVSFIEDCMYWWAEIGDESLLLFDGRTPRTPGIRGTCFIDTIVTRTRLESNKRNGYKGTIVFRCALFNALTRPSSHIQHTQTQKRREPKKSPVCLSASAASASTFVAAQMLQLKYLMFNLFLSIWISLSCSWWLVSTCPFIPQKKREKENESYDERVPTWPFSQGLNEIDFLTFPCSFPLFTCRFRKKKQGNKIGGLLKFFRFFVIFSLRSRNRKKERKEERKKHTWMEITSSQSIGREPREPLSVISQQGVFMVIELKLRSISSRPVSFCGNGQSHSHREREKRNVPTSVKTHRRTAQHTTPNAFTYPVSVLSVFSRFQLENQTILFCCRNV